MIAQKEHDPALLDVADEVRDFYDRYPYPPPTDSLEKYRLLWQDPRKTPRGFSFILARSRFFGNAVHPRCGLRHNSGGKACRALACVAGYGY